MEKKEGKTNGKRRKTFCTINSNVNASPRASAMSQQRRIIDFIRPSMGRQAK